MTEAALETATPNHSSSNPAIRAMLTDSKRIKSELEKAGGLIDQDWSQDRRTALSAMVKSDGEGQMRLRWTTDESKRVMSIIIESVKGTGQSAKPVNSSFLIVTRDYNDNTVSALVQVRDGYRIVPSILKDIGAAAKSGKLLLDVPCWDKLLQSASRSFGR